MNKAKDKDQLQAARRYLGLLFFDNAGSEGSRDETEYDGSNGRFDSVEIEML